MVKIHLIPNQKLRTKDSEQYLNTYFTFQRDGSDETEKGTVGTFVKVKGQTCPVREALEAALAAGTAIELEEGQKDAYGQVKFSLPKKAIPGGSGGRPISGFKGKILSEEEFFDFFGRVKNRVNEGNKRLYPNLEAPVLAELTRAEVAQIVIMVKENLIQVGK